MKEKLHLGCGHEILPDFVNLDGAPLPGVDVVHNLNEFPWPFPDHQFNEIIVKHVLEHLPQTIQVMEEMHRISKPGAIVKLRIPYWNSADFINDPTHVKAFNENTFDFFDPDHPRCQERPYYSTARFRVRKKIYFFTVFGRYFSVHTRALRFLMEKGARFFCNIIQVIEFHLEAVK